MRVCNINSLYLDLLRKQNRLNWVNYFYPKKERNSFYNMNLHGEIFTTTQETWRKMFQVSYFFPISWTHLSHLFPIWKGLERIGKDWKHQLLTVNCQLSILNSQLSILNYQLSTVNCQFSTVNWIEHSFSAMVRMPSLSIDSSSSVKRL